jgi:glyoxylase-like metal-dependent hydrolase (beta-lactamase superfamily II)
MKTWPTETVELARGVFAYVQATGAFCIANAGVIDAAVGATDGDATAIDALFTPAMTRLFLDEASHLVSAPVARLISTHHHLDHTLGNGIFPRETRIMAHARAKAEMERTGWNPRLRDLLIRTAPHFAAELDDASLRLPDETFHGATMDIEIGGRAVRLLHPGTAHTRGDVLVHLPDDGVLFAGDVAFFHVTPLAFEGHIGNWIAVCRRVLAMDAIDVIVPGHGPVGDAADLRAMLGYLELVHDASRRAFDAGASAEEAERGIDLGEYEFWGERERLTANVARCYQEFRGELDAVLA